MSGEVVRWALIVVLGGLLGIVILDGVLGLMGEFWAWFRQDDRVYRGTRRNWT